MNDNLIRNITEPGTGAKLNLGCGDDIRSGYLNIDFRQTHPNVIITDLSKRPWPFANESANEILMLDFLEHFPYVDTIPILFECYRVLEPNGTVVIQVPDATQVCRAIIQEGDYLCNRCERPTTWDPSCSGCGGSRDTVSHDAVKRLFGGQNHVGNFHYTTFTRSLLIESAKQAGLELVGYEEEDHQWRMWNFKARFKRGEIW